MKTNHAVIYYPDRFMPNTALLQIVNGKWQEEELAEPMRRLSDFCELAVDRKITHLWVMPNYEPRPNIDFMSTADPEQWDLLASWMISDEEIADAVQEQEENLLISVTGCKKPKGGQHWFSICFPAQSQWSWYDEDLTPKLLLQVVRYMEAALGVEVGAGPTTVGMKLLQSLHTKEPDVIKKPDIDLAPLPFAQAARTLVWETENMDALVKAGKYLHKDDKNSDFLRASVETRQGIGNPVHVFNSQGADEGLPGIWRISQIAPDRADKRLPAPLWRGAEWVSTPVVKMLRKLGYELLIDEGWMFPTHSKILAAWAKYLWDSRQSFRNDTGKWKHPVARELARDGIKDVAATTVGLLNSTNKAIQQTWKYRPDWWCQVVGEARALMFYNMRKFADKGYYPCMVYIDALFYITDTPEPVPGILDHKDSLGGYKHEWTLEITPEVRDILLSNDGPNKKIGLLNILAGEVN